MSTMRAVLIKDGKGPIENLYVGLIERPVPKESEVLVKITAFGLNRMDLAQREGMYPPPPGTSHILGVEFSGIVHQLGPGVTKWSQGDEVYGLVGGGAYAEYVVCNHGLLIKKPATLSWVEAASIPENYITGVAAIQIARVLGAHTVTATASTRDKLEWLLSIPNGATHAVNYTSDNFAEHVKQTTNGKGVDVIIDFVGRTHWEKNIDSLAIDGRMILLAFLSGKDATLAIRDTFIKGIPVQRRRCSFGQSTADPVQAAQDPGIHAAVSEFGLSDGADQQCQLWGGSQPDNRGRRQRAATDLYA
ncbi:putative quinone oxidoreductase [Boletus reticuloceps]|uniref:Putative quinone oxidoreductase n=1 Tax=Boletus reticuloceps TaxID=495285 RepID=A0A8I3A9U1_9AGAM|nr:putative quinone oxidoreductase [Boletus reticuloceps]